MVVIVDVVVEEEEEKILVLVEDVEKNSIKKDGRKSPQENDR